MMGNTLVLILGSVVIYLAANPQKMRAGERERVRIMKRFLFWMILLHPFICFGLDPERAITQYVHQVWKTEHGLPQKRVNDILQTKDGYLWFTSPENLVRFDGLKFTIFESGRIPSLTSRNLPVLVEDLEGNLWIATEGAGVARYKDGSFFSFTTKNGLSDNSVLSIAVDRKGALWIGTQWGGLNHLQNGKVTVYKAKDGTPGNRINFLFVDERGDLWIAGEGLSRFHNGTFKRYTKADGLSHDVVTSITSDRKGSIWLGTWGGGVNKLENGKFISYSTTEGLSHNEVRNIHYDKGGNLWVGTREGGLCRFKDGKWETYSQPQGLSDNGVRALYEDRDGSLWIGTYSQGLNRLKNGTFISYSSEEGFPADEVWSIYGDRHGTLWMGTQNGIVQYSNGIFKSFGVESGLTATNAVSIHGDSTGQLWVGTRGGGLFVFKNGHFTQFPFLKGTSYQFINCLYVDRSDNVWVGLADGAIRIQNGQIQQYSTRDGLAHNSTSGFLEDRSGNLWIASRGGLSYMRNNQFKSFSTEAGVVSMHEDNDGTLWVGMLGRLCRFQNEKFRCYTARDGLHHDTASAITDDDAGNLWISGSKGIFRVHKKNFLDYDKGLVSSIHSIIYGLADGMKDSEGNSGDPAVWKTSDGRLWFPTLKGITVVNPRNIIRSHGSIPAVIEKFLADHQDYDPKKKDLKIPPGQKRLEFYYAGLNLFAPERIRFQYKLDGYDKEWQYGGTQRSASYTNIPPGNYTFRIRAGNEEGEWSEQGSSVAFYLRPRFYQTKWFYFLCFIGLVVTTASAYRLRMKRIRAEFKAVLEERLRIAREFHDSLAQALAGVVMHLEVARIHASPEQSKHHTERALNLARISVEEARQTVIELRKPPDYETDFASALKEEILRQTIDSNLKVDFQAKGDAKNISESMKTNLIRICQEAVHNITKHAKATCVYVSLVCGSDKVSIHIKDDGAGFDPDAGTRKDRHFGLVGMRERVSVLRGTIQIQSELGKGTEIHVTVPLKT